MPTMPTWSLQFDANDFLHSLCKWIVAQAALFAPPVSLVYSTTPRSLWRDMAQEGPAATPFATDPYTVIRTYAGSPLKYTDRLPRQSLQVQTTGSGDEAAKAQCGAVFQAFTDGDGLPLRSVVISGFKAASDAADGTWQIVFADLLQRPGTISRDERGRVTIGFNVEIGLRKLS